MIFEAKRSVTNIKNILVLCSFLAALITQQLTFMMPISAAISSMSGLVIYQLQTASTGSALQEYVAIHNNTDESVDITGHCVSYGSSSDVTQTQLACFVAPAPNIKLLLSPHSSATLASAEFTQLHSGFTPDLVFSPAIAATSGHVRLLNPAKSPVDTLGWGSAVHPEGSPSAAHSSGKILQRNMTEVNFLKDTGNNATDFYQTDLVLPTANGIYEEVIPSDSCINLVDFQDVIPDGYLLDTVGNCVQDMCTNIDGLQAAVPNKFVTDGSICTQTPSEDRIIFITEVLPNPTGADAENEFIELYNPHDEPVSLKDYVLRLDSTLPKSYVLPELTLEPRAYKALKQQITGLILPNTAADVSLTDPSGVTVSAIDAYSQPPEDASWALFNESWYVTFQPTPNAPNSILSIKPCTDGYSRSPDTGRCRLDTENDAGVNAVECLVGQVRNTVTNRCRKIPEVSTATICKATQVHNPETGRCRTITTSATVVCKSGYERNAGTGRCRKIVEPVNKTCPAGQERNKDTNRCRKIAGGGGSALPSVKDVATPIIENNLQWWAAGIGGTGSLGYGVYEWRRETLSFFKGIKSKLGLGTD